MPLKGRKDGLGNRRKRAVRKPQEKHDRTEAKRYRNRHADHQKGHDHHKKQSDFHLYFPLGTRGRFFDFVFGFVARHQAVNIAVPDPESGLNEAEQDQAHG